MDCLAARGRAPAPHRHATRVPGGQQFRMRAPTCASWPATRAGSSDEAAGRSGTHHPASFQRTVAERRGRGQQAGRGRPALESGGSPLPCCCPFRFYGPAPVRVPPHPVPPPPSPPQTRVRRPAAGGHGHVHRPASATCLRGGRAGCLLAAGRLDRQSTLPSLSVVASTNGSILPAALTLWVLSQARTHNFATDD